MRVGNFHCGLSVVHPVLVTANVSQELFLGIDFLGKHNTLMGNQLKLARGCEPQE